MGKSFTRTQSSSGGMSDEGKVDASAGAVSSMLFNYHFPMVKSKSSQPYIEPASTMLLGLTARTLNRKKGIKLSPRKTFRYGNKTGAEKYKRSLYLYEAGLMPEHVKNLQHVIDIHVKSDSKGTVLIGTLSAKRPWIQLQVTLGEDCELTHNSPSKAVFFNGFQFSLAKRNKLVVGRAVWSNPKSVTLEANKQLWVEEVHPSRELRLNHVGEGKEYHLLEVYSRENTDEDINLHVTCNERKELLGKLISGCRRMKLNSMFDNLVTLSHTSSTSSIFFSGYMVPNQPFKLKELNKYAGDPGKDLLMSSPKVSLDPEYHCYRARLKKVPTGISKQQTMGNPMQTEVNPRTAPLIFGHQGSCQFLTANPRGLFWVQNQEVGTSSQEDSSDEEDRTTPNKPEDGKKRLAETPLKISASDKKAKIATPSGQTTGHKKVPDVATPHPAKQASKTKAKSPNSAGTHACKSCSRIFGSDLALQSHEKATHT